MRSITENPNKSGWQMTKKKLKVKNKKNKNKQKIKILSVESCMSEWKWTIIFLYS